MTSKWPDLFLMIRWSYVTLNLHTTPLRLKKSLTKYPVLTRPLRPWELKCTWCLYRSIWPFPITYAGRWRPCRWVSQVRSPRCCCTPRGRRSHLWGIIFYLRNQGFYPVASQEDMYVYKILTLRLLAATESSSSCRKPSLTSVSECASHVSTQQREGSFGESKLFKLLHLSCGVEVAEKRI